MKVFLVTGNSASSQPVIDEILRAGHLLTTIVDEPHLLIHEIARTTPHLLVYHGPAGALSDQINHVALVFPELLTYAVVEDLSPRQTSWQAALQKFLRQPIQPETPAPYADDSRLVYHDQDLAGFWQGRLNRPKQEKGWEQRCSQQEARFVLQLQAGRKNHGAARRYFDCLVAQQAGLDQELAYRLVHGSYKALSWSRDLAVKWLALLAHYVPQVELEYLPRVGTPGPAIDYVHREMPLEGMYAATLIMVSKVKPSIDKMIKELITARFEKQDDESLLLLSIQLYGIAKLFEQVGRAQIALMDAWLDPNFGAGDQDILRSDKRSAGIYRDFHDLNYIVHYPAPLASTLRGFHAGTTYVTEEGPLLSFAEFRRLIRENTKEAEAGPTGSENPTA